MAPPKSTKANHNMLPPPQSKLQKPINHIPKEPSPLSIVRTMSQNNAEMLFQPEELSAQLDLLQRTDHSAITGTPSAFQLKLKEFKSPPGIPPYKGSNLRTSPNLSRSALTTGHGTGDHLSAYDAYLAKTYGTPIDGPAIAEPGADPSATHREQVLKYIYSWVEWASRIDDSGRRTEVMAFVKEALEGALRHGIEIRAFRPEDVNGVKKGVSGEVRIEIEVKARAEVVAEEGSLEGGDVVPSAEKIDAPQEVITKSIQGTKRDTVDAGVEYGEREPASKKQKTDAEKHVPDESQVVKEGDFEQRAMEADAEQMPTDGKAGQTHEPTTSAGEGQQQTSPETNPGGAKSDGEEPSPEEEAKHDRYLQQVFRPRFNIVMKMAGKALARGKCSDWHTCRQRLEDAGVDAKHRNMFLRDFENGYKKWNESVQGDPNLEIAEYLIARHAKLHQRAVRQREATIGSSEKKGPKVTPAQLAAVPTPAALTRVSTDETGRRVLSIRTYPGFDAVDYSHYAIFEYRNFIFEYTVDSTVKERFCLGERLSYLVDTTLAGKGWYHFTFRQVEVRNEQGKVIAVGMFVERKPDIIYGDEDLRHPDEVAPPLLSEKFNNPARSTEQDGEELEDGADHEDRVNLEDQRSSQTVTNSKT